MAKSKWFISAVLIIALACALGCACSHPCPTPTPCPTCVPCPPCPTPTSTPVTCNLPPARPDMPPCGFWGNVTLYGYKVPDGTAIGVIIGGCIYQITTPSNHGYSTYRLVLNEPSGENYQWQHITFTVNSVPYSHQAVWIAAANFEFDIKAGE